MVVSDGSGTMGAFGKLWAEFPTLNVTYWSNTDTSDSTTCLQLYSQNKEVLGDSSINIKMWWVDISCNVD